MEFLVYVLSALVFAGRVVGEEGLVPRRLVARNTTLFHHRGFHNSIVVGNYLYIDGGEITTWNGDGDGLQFMNPQPDGNIVTNLENYTFSIDLSSSWTNSSVTLNQIRKESPVLNNEALWLDASGESFYSYDGAISMGPANWPNTVPPNNMLWQFTPSGDSGSWQQAGVSASSNFSALSRVTAANYASGNGLGFALGGQQSYATYHYDFGSIFDYMLAPGLVMYNDSSKEWYNISAESYSYYGFGSGGVAQFVPTFGENGLLLVLGGWTTQTQQLVPMSSVSLYDPSTQQWQNQATTGEAPGENANACIVGLEGDKGTYEIFVYGGQVNGDVERTASNGAVYVLSLPSFHWSKESSPQSYGRYMHSCNVVGNRQMAVIGGIVIQPGDSNSVFTVSGGTPDPWDQGIGIFDLSDMQWKNSYDASAASYVTPDVVKSYTAQNGEYAKFGNSVVEAWFKHPGSGVSSGSGSGSGSSGTPENGTSSSGSSNTGAIAGGVVGGVVGAALIAGLAFYLVRRRRRQQQQGDAFAFHKADRDQHILEAEGEGHQHELSGSHAMAELPVRDKPAEAPGDGFDGSSKPAGRYEHISELPADGKR